MDRSRCKCHDQAAVAEFNLLGGMVVLNAVAESYNGIEMRRPRRAMRHYMCQGSHCIIIQKKFEVLLLLLSVSQCFRAVVFAKGLSMF